MNAALAVLAAGVSMLAGSGPAAGPAQPLPTDAVEWRLEYSISGGIAGFRRVLTMTNDGRLEVEDATHGHHVSGHATDAVMAKIKALIAAARDERRVKPMPDAIYSMLVVTAGGRQRRIDVSGEIGTVMNDVIDAAVARALAGSWYQSAWKLCSPVAQLGPGDVDPPIETLVFDEEGRFSVTWSGEGPEYRGTYTLRPGTGWMQLRIDDGWRVPRDFFGNGLVSIRDATVTFRNIWFGTKQAKRKPNICELTFTKKSS